jgi:TetR/AcrR family transcriptional regulator, cholesterol catabolism regulator
MMDIRTQIKNQNLIERKRQHIVDCATKLFLANGYHRTNTAAIANACNMSEGSLYRYIGARDDILYLILKRMVNIDEKVCAVNLDAPDIVSYKQVLKDLLKRHTEIVDQSKSVYIFNFTAMQTCPKEVENKIFEGANKIIEYYEKLLSKGNEAGEFAVKDTYLVANCLASFCHNWALRHWYLRKKYTLQEYIDKITDYALESVYADKS